MSRGGRSGDPEFSFQMPLLQGLARIEFELGVASLDLRPNPRRPETQHHVDRRGRGGQLAIDRRGEGMDEFRPLRGKEPERRGAMRAEAALAGRQLARPILPLNLRSEDFDGAVGILDFERRRLRAQVDGVAPAASRLATDRAIAALVGPPGCGFGRRIRPRRSGTIPRASRAWCFDLTGLSFESNARAALPLPRRAPIH
jgi:hypothetical protein